MSVYNPLVKINWIHKIPDYLYPADDKWNKPHQCWFPYPYISTDFWAYNLVYHVYTIHDVFILSCTSYYIHHSLHQCIILLQLKQFLCQITFCLQHLWSFCSRHTGEKIFILQKHLRLQSQITNTIGSYHLHLAAVNNTQSKNWNTCSTQMFNFVFNLSN